MFLKVCVETLGEAPALWALRWCLRAGRRNMCFVSPGQGARAAGQFLRAVPSLPGTLDPSKAFWGPTLSFLLVTHLVSETRKILFMVS